MQKQTIQSRYVTLREWAAMMFSQVPHKNTLLKWVKDGHIYPQPEKVGKSWQAILAHLLRRHAARGPRLRWSSRPAGAARPRRLAATRGGAGL